ncbi:MAG: hypothetical protein KDK55_04315 [Chlamydiia bacterium]|nr:hypothetical protein [Chlamydiia bacterium]
MNPDLFQLKELILLFRNQLADRIPWTHEGINPSLEKRPKTLQQWEKDEAYSWIFLETNYLFFWGLSDESNRSQLSLAYPNYPECLLQPAESVYSKWGMQEKKIGDYRGITSLIKEIYKYKRYGIPPPETKESLIVYVKRLKRLVSEETISKKIWKESLGCFLEFVRISIPQEHLGFIDVIFPEDRAFHSDSIIRLIRKEKFPTNIIFTAQILKNLSEEMLWGDVRSQLAAAESLAFSWLCLTSARLQLPTTIKLLRTFDCASLTKEKCPERKALPERYTLKIPTQFGSIPVEISKLLFNYLCILAKNIQTNCSFFCSSQRSLERTFDRAVNQRPLRTEEGEITFTTLTSWPNEVMHYRTQINNARYSKRNTLS